MEFSSPNDHDDDRRPGLTAASLFLVLIAFWIVTRIEYVIILGLFGLLLGTILEGPVRRIEARHVPRPAAIFMIYAAIIGLLVLLVFAIIPVVSDQVDTFREDIPEQLATLEQEWKESSNPLLSGTGAAFLGRAQEYLDNPEGGVEVSTDTVQNVIPVISSITAGIIGVVTTLVVTFYYMMEKAFIRKLVIGQLDPRRQPRIDKIWQDVENKVGGWMRGQLLLCLIIGTIATISYGALGITFWPLLGLWAGITEIIPIVGPWIGGIPAVIVALTLGWDKALLVGIVIICMQTLENWFLVPRVMRGAVGLSPLTVFVAILSGTQFMGVTGAILAIPIAAAIQVILTDYFAARQLKRDPQQMAGWRWMLSRPQARDEDEPIEVVQEFGPMEDELAQAGQTVSADVNLQPESTTAPSDTPNGVRRAAAPARRTPGWAPFGADQPASSKRPGTTDDSTPSDT
jgi:predicted PurR-regulated permease PerM